MSENKVYHSFDEIHKELKTLQLKRAIAVEEMKLVKSELKNDLKAYQWAVSLLGVLKKYGFSYLMKKILK